MKKRCLSFLLSIIIALTVIPLFTVFAADYNAQAKSATQLSSPVISSVYVNNAGVVIKWGRVKGASKYRVFYKQGNTWKKITDTSSTSYTWSGAKTGTKYTLTVRCVNSSGKYISGFDAKGKTIACLPAPKISSIRAVNAGTEIKWNKVSGAEKYKVLRKKGNGAWSLIGTVSSTGFTDTKAEKGTEYAYTVRCVSNNGKVYTSGYYEAEMKFTARAVPKVSSVSVTADGVKINWKSVSKAEKYRLFRRTGSGGWVALTTTNATSFVDKNTKSGNKYTYTVRCVSADGRTYISGYDTTGRSITFVAAPKISSVSAKSSGIKISWGKVSGAEKYRVFRRTPKGNWINIGTTAYTSFTDIKANKGTTYFYTVRCMNKNESGYTSAYDTTGKSAVSVSSPVTKNDMVSVAEKQLGYSGGQKIWRWAGYDHRVPWCNLFVTWCANELGYYQSGRIPLYQAPKDSAQWFKSKGRFKGPGYTPKAGDLVFFALYGETAPYHIGLVEKYENGTVYTIEGNSDDVVKRRSYPHDNYRIYGYAAPDYGHN